MKVFYEVKVLAVVAHSFTDKEGVQVEYNECYFLNEAENGERSVYKFNSKNEQVKALEGESAVIEVDIADSMERKPRLIGIRKG